MNSSTPPCDMSVHTNYHSAFYGAVMLLLAFAVGTPDRASFADSRSVELLFADPRSHSAPGDRCEDEICTRLLKLIQTAEKSIDFAVYGMRNQTQLLEAIEAAQARGVVVRGVVDRDRTGENYYTSTNLWARRLGNIRDDFDAETILDQRDTWKPHQPPCPRPAGFEGPLQCLAYDLGDRWLVAAHASRETFDQRIDGRIMHNKFFVVDRRWVWTGSANLSDSGTGGYNANIVAVVNSPRLADVYTNEFEQMWGAGHFHQLKESNDVERFAIGDTDTQVWFSPQDKTMSKGVQPLIAGAQHRIDLAVFFLTNKYVTAELIAAHRRGVDVRVIIDATSSQNEYSKHELLREAGVPVKVENWGGKMHLKAAAVDGRVVVVGSMNWTSAGEFANDENSLFFRSPRLVADFEAFFDRVWDSIPKQWHELTARPDPESAQSSTACSDGIDNDFDELIDAKDPGCSDNPPRMPDLPTHWTIPKNGSNKPPTGYPLIRSLGK